jgi:hypothetical protein
MFSEFSEVEYSQEFEFADNGYVLRVSGRNQKSDWVKKTYVFREETLFFKAIQELNKIDKS